MGGLFVGGYRVEHVVRGVGTGARPSPSSIHHRCAVTLTQPATSLPLLSHSPPLLPNPRMRRPILLFSSSSLLLRSSYRLTRGVPKWVAGHPFWVAGHPPHPNPARPIFPTKMNHTTHLYFSSLPFSPLSLSPSPPGGLLQCRQRPLFSLFRPFFFLFSSQLLSNLTHFYLALK